MDDLLAIPIVLLAGHLLGRRFCRKQMEWERACAEMDDPTGELARRRCEEEQAALDEWCRTGRWELP